MQISTTAVVGLGLIASLLAGCGGQQSDSGAKPNAAADVQAAGPVKFQEPDAFYSLLRLTSANYVPLSEGELLEKSSFVGVGRIVDVVDGMEIRSVHAKVPVVLRTLVLRLDVEKVIKGEAPGGYVLFEYLHGGAFDVATYKANLPEHSALLFLAPAARQKSSDYEYTQTERGYPAGRPPYRLTTRQGWFIEGKGALRQPLTSSSVETAFANVSTLNAVAEQLLSIRK